jgi:hypothetical protein
VWPGSLARDTCRLLIVLLRTACGHFLFLSACILLDSSSLVAANSCPLSPPRSTEVVRMALTGFRWMNVLACLCRNRHRRGG